MLGRIAKTVANEYLRSRRARAGRPPPTSIGEAQSRVVPGVARWIARKLFKN